MVWSKTNHHHQNNEVFTASRTGLKAHLNKTFKQKDLLLNPIYPLPQNSLEQVSWSPWKIMTQYKPKEVWGGEISRRRRLVVGQFPISAVLSSNLLCGLSDFYATQQAGHQLHFPASNNASAWCPSMASVSTMRSLIEKAKHKKSWLYSPYSPKKGKGSILEI